MNQYRIHEGNMERLEKKLKTIETKAKKYGCTFSYKKVDEVYDEIFNEESGETRVEKFIIVEVEGVAKISGWEFIGTIQHMETGNIIRTHKTAVEIPELYKTVKSRCDHCNTIRARIDTYILFNAETKEYKQVGRNCLANFFGIDAEKYTNYLSCFDTIAEFDNKENINGKYNKYYIKVDDFLMNVAECIRIEGFVSSEKAREWSRPTTGSRAYDCMYQTSGVKDWMDEKGYTQDVTTHAETIKNALNWLQNQTDNTMYMYNLQLACKDEYTEYRNLNLIASLLPSYTRAMGWLAEKDQKQKELQTQKEKSHYIGNIGDKIEFKAKVKLVTTFSTPWGTTKVFKFIDENDNSYIWKTSSWIDESDDLKTIKGTVKAHTEFNQEKQTELIRCKVM